MATTIKLKSRNPEKFGVLDLFDDISRSKKLVLGNEKDKNSFLSIINNALSDKTPTIIYGRRVEAMFAYVAASLGKSILIKKEECGDMFVDDDSICVPDYRIVLDNSEQLLVEVKNYYQKSSFKTYSMNTSYLDGLLRYAALMNTELRIAIYWTIWAIWTLVSPNDFERKESKAEISLTTAIMRNQMSILGDVFIGTVPPLSLRIYTDKQKPHSISEDGTSILTIGKVEILANNIPITLESEQRIAFALMQYGNWKETNKVVTTKQSPKEVDYIEFSYFPEEYDESQGISIIGSLSTIISRQYGYLTAPKGKIRCLSPDVEPGTLGVNIPEGYEGEALPLWRFHQELSD